MSAPFDRFEMAGANFHKILNSNFVLGNDAW